MNTFTIILMAGGGVALVLLIIGIVTSLSSERAMVEERLGRYVQEEVVITGRDQAQSTPITDWINRQVVGSSFGERISRDLARADIKLKPGEYLATIIIAAFGVGLIAWFIGGKSLPLGIIGALCGAFLPSMYVKREQSKRLLRFNGQLADMLNLMVNGLRAGFSTMQAMEAVSKELPPPICDEFRRVVQEMQLGVSMETTLDNLLRRIPSEDLDLVVTAVNVQREVGGNLADILDTISFTIRERVRIKGEIRVLTSQVMYSGRFLSLLPVIVIGILYVMNKDYMMEFFKPESFPCGYIALGVAGTLIVSGYFAMNKLADIEL
jgi:tight adherence protein B